MREFPADEIMNHKPQGKTIDDISKTKSDEEDKNSPGEERDEVGKQ